MGHNDLGLNVGHNELGLNAQAANPEYEDLRLNDPTDRLRKALNRWGKSDSVTEFKFRKVTISETCKLISRLGTSCSFGIDGLDANFLKLVLPSIAAPVCHSINTSLLECTWPNRWKIGKIFPLLKDKSADKLLPASYRPVCILPTLSKIAERAAQVQLQKFFTSTGQLNSAEHAYRKAHSMTTTIASIAD